MLFDPARHEPLAPSDATWDAPRARGCISAIVRDTEARFRPGLGWPMHPLDAEPGDSLEAGNPSLYFGDCGVLWALHHLHAAGATELTRPWPIDPQWLMQRTRDWLKERAERERASFMMGETPVRL
ncbi:MAG TPA: hypothetical protein VML58_07915, partial [Burkholderiaceae bacterium]|nr:hypothetical protein [Burkholderiaceae bacterium]